MTEAFDNNKVRIRQQAMHLFMQYGIRSVSMDDIAAAMGSSKKTLYQYYSDKNTLVEGAVSAVLDLNESKCQKGKIVATNAIEEAFLAIDNTAELFKRMNPLLIYDLKKYHPKAYKTFIDYKNEFLFQILKSNIEWGKKEGLFREDLNVELVARFRVENILIMFQPDFQSKFNASMAEIHRELFYHFIYGMVTPKGYELVSKYKQEFIKKLSND